MLDRTGCGQAVGIRVLPSYRSSNIGPLHSAATKAPTSRCPCSMRRTQYCTCAVLHRPLHTSRIEPRADRRAGCLLAAVLSHAVMSCDVL